MTTEYLANVNKLAEAINKVFELAHHLNLNDTEVMDITLETIIDRRVDQGFDDRLMEEAQHQEEFLGEFWPTSTDSAQIVNPNTEDSMKRYPSYQAKQAQEQPDDETNSLKSNVVKVNFNKPRNG